MCRSLARHRKHSGQTAIKLTLHGGLLGGSSLDDDEEHESGGNDKDVEGLVGEHVGLVLGPGDEGWWEGNNAPAFYTFFLEWELENTFSAVVENSCMITYSKGMDKSQFFGATSGRK